MPVYKDELRNSWYISVRYQDWTGERKQKLKRGFLTKKDALTWERNFLQKQSADMKMDFKAFTELYFSDKANRIKERTLKNKKYMIYSKVIPFFGKKAMCDIKPTDIIQWQNSMLDEGYSETYLRMLQNQVTAIFSHAERLYGLYNNPCKKVNKIGRSDAKRLNFWTVEEYNQFRNSLRGEVLYETLFDTLFWTGCRIGEALALTMADVDFESRNITINKTFYRHERMDIITEPKTESSNRVVSIPAKLAETIRKYVDYNYGGLDQDDRLFQVADRAVQKKIVRNAEKAGVRRIRVHDLRHSHVALLIEKGVSPLAIAERVGHDSINTTMNTYGHLYPNKQREIADMLQLVLEEK